MTDRYAVFGNPIKHSLSPLIHAEFARQTGRDVNYVKELVAEGEFVSAAGQFFASGGKGLNVTVPFKLDAVAFANRLTERARRAGAVNTLAIDAGEIILGDNTDGVGLVRDIRDNQGWLIAGASVLLLGAGGAVRGVLEPLLSAQPRQVVIANRTREKAIELAAQFGDLGNVSGCGFDELDHAFDIVINGTSASLGGELPPLPKHLVTATSCCYDMMYGALPTVFLQWAADCGAQNLADGLGMLVEQAAEAFLLWQGVRPETGPVIATVREHLRNSVGA